MERAPDTDGFAKLYRYYSSNKVRKSVKKSVEGITSVPDHFEFDEISGMSDETIRNIIRSRHDSYGKEYLLSIVSGILLSYFGAYGEIRMDLGKKHTNKYLSLCTEYILRRIRKCEYELIRLGISKEKRDKIFNLEAVLLDRGEKSELFKNIINLRLATKDEAGIKRVSERELACDEEFQAYLEQVRVTIFSNVIEFNQSSLKSNDGFLLGLFDLNGVLANGISTKSDIIGLEGNLNMNLVGEHMSDDDYNTNIHELWHSIELFFTEILGELIPEDDGPINLEQDFSNSKIFKNMKKDELINDFEFLKSSNPQFFEFIFGLENIDEPIELDYLILNKEMIAQMIGTKFFVAEGTPSPKEFIKLSEEITKRMIVYIKPFSNLLVYPFDVLDKHFHISADDQREISPLISKYFNKLFTIVNRLISFMVRLSVIRGNRQSPFIELGFVPVHKWESYVKMQEGIHRGSRRGS